MQRLVWVNVQGAIQELTSGIISTAAARNGTARESGFDVDGIENRATDETKLMGRLRAIRQELEDLEFTEYL